MFKIKRTIKKIIVSGLIALILSVNAPTVVGFFTDAPAHSHETTAFAEDAAPSTASAESLKDMEKKVATIIQIQHFLNILIWPLLVLTGGLMDSSLLFGGGMENLLREIWIPIRNVVNLLFVLVLVGIALYNVLGLGEDQGEYSIKKILPSLIIGIIAVNFSFTGIKVFLDMVNVLTVSIFAIPGSIQEELSTVLDSEAERDKEIIKNFCLGIQGQTMKKDKDGKPAALKAADIEELEGETKAIVARSIAKSDRWKLTFPETISKSSEADIIALAAAKGSDTEKAFKEDLDKGIEGFICYGAELSSQGKIFLKKWNSRNGALALALNMTNIVFYESIPLNSKNIEKLLINSLFSVLLYIIYAASFVALFIVLLARLVVLWVSIAISPILLLIIAVPKIKEKMGDIGELSDKFIKNAIAPILIALAMTVGWIMLRGIQSLTGLEDGGGGIGLKATQGTSIIGLTTLQDLMVALGTVAVVWLGVFSAASETIAAPITDSIKGGIQSAASWMGQLPLKHAPIFPIKVPGSETDTFTFAQIGDAMQDITGPPKDVDKLSLLINPRSSEAKEALSDITGADDDVKQWYNEHNGKGAAKIAKMLRSEFSDKRFDKLTKKMSRKGGDDKAVATQLEIMRTSKDSADIEAAHKELIRLSKGAGTKKKKKDPADTGTPATTPVAPKLTPPPAKAKVGADGKSLKDLEPQVQQRIATGTEAIQTETNKTDTKTIDNSKVKELLRGLGAEGVQPNQIEAVIGAESWEKLKEVFPQLKDEDKVKEALETNTFTLDKPVDIPAAT